MKPNLRIPKKLAALAVVSSVALTATTATSVAQTDKASGDTVSLVAYSTPREAYGELIKAFQATPDGQGVNFTQSFGASGDQARAVKAGLKADVVNLALAPDVSDLAASQLVRNTWNKGSYKGMVTDSVVVFVTRQGNPKRIHEWKDLVKPDVSVITPNPFTSGGARWNVMAAYGAQLKAGKTPAQALAYLNTLFQHVAVQDKSAREALQTFISGKGDVMLAYQNEAIAAQRAGNNISYVVPKYTILIENPLAVTVRGEGNIAAQHFAAWLLSKDAQTIWAKYGYRPVNPAVKSTQVVPKGLFTITMKGLDGWLKAQPKFFDPQKGLMVKISQQGN